MSETQRTRIGSIELDETDAELLLDNVAWGARVTTATGAVLTYDPRTDPDSGLLDLVEILLADPEAEYERIILDAELDPDHTEQRGRQPPLLAFTAAYKFDDLQKDLVHRNGGWVTDFYYRGEWYDTVGFEYDAEASQFGTVTFTVGEG